MNIKLLERRIIILIAVFVFMMACSIPKGINIGGSDSSADQTRVAVGIQSTMLALQLTKSAGGNNDQSTDTAPQSTSQQILPPTYTPYPTYTIPAADLPLLPEITITEDVIHNTQDMQARIDNAKILVYDDSYGSYDIYGRALVSRIEEALDGLGLNGANVHKVHDAMGNFMNELNSGTQWDLIIVGAESRNYIRGEFWDIIGDHINNNVAVISELWYLDQIAGGRIAPVLSGCGIAFEKNWERNEDANLNNYLVYILEPENPLFSNPNTIGMLIPTSDYAWEGDVGDRMKLTSDQGILLAGSLPNEHSRYGLISSCHEGRVIFQTFDTHDYKIKDMIPLWQNYVINTLTNHFLVTP